MVESEVSKAHFSPVFDSLCLLPVDRDVGLWYSSVPCLSACWHAPLHDVNNSPSETLSKFPVKCFLL